MEERGRHGPLRVERLAQRGGTGRVVFGRRGEPGVSGEEVRLEGHASGGRGREDTDARDDAEIAHPRAVPAERHEALQVETVETEAEGTGAGAIEPDAAGPVPARQLEAVAGGRDVPGARGDPDRDALRQLGRQRSQLDAAESSERPLSEETRPDAGPLEAHGDATPRQREAGDACTEGKPDLHAFQGEREAPLRGLRHEPLPQLSLERRFDESYGAPEGRPGQEGGEGDQEESGDRETSVPRLYRVPLLTRRRWTPTVFLRGGTQDGPGREVGTEQDADPRGGARPLLAPGLSGDEHPRHLDSPPAYPPAASTTTSTTRKSSSTRSSPSTGPPSRARISPSTAPSPPARFPTGSRSWPRRPRRA